jgi:hypothetical protein
MPKHPRTRPMSRGSLRFRLKARTNFIKGVTSVYAHRFGQPKYPFSGFSNSPSAVQNLLERCPTSLPQLERES